MQKPDDNLPVEQAASTRGRPKGESPIRGFIRKVTQHPKIDEAKQWIKEQAGLLWDRVHGAELAQITEEMASLLRRCETTQQTLDALEKAKANTSRFIKAGTVHTGKDDGVVHFRDWHRRDQILIWVLGTFAVVCMVMGWSNVYTNLLASGEPVFLDSPWLAGTLAALSPIASIAVKWVTHFFRYDKTRQRYSISVFALTLIVLLLWTVLFVDNFPGVASPVLFDADDGFDTGPMLVWSQLMLEILAASCLWLGVEEIWIRYAPGWYVENQEYVEIDKAINTLRPELDEFHERLRVLQGRKTTLEADRQAYINEQIATFIALKARFNEQFNFND